jgi:putative DNA primase/helicase
LTDSSGALASRFIILTLQNSFYGTEDHTLLAKLSKEMPGILNWAIDRKRRSQVFDDVGFRRIRVSA